MSPLDLAIRPATLSAAERAERLISRFQQRAAANDRDSRLPLDNIADLQAAKLLGLSVPTTEGGDGASLSEALAVITRISRGDASTALLLSLHYQWQAAIGRSG